MERIQKNFKLIRETKKFSQRTLANGICSQSLISRFEAGKDIPSALILKKLCDRLQVKIDLLFKENSLLATEIEQNLFKAYLHKNYKLIESILEKRNLSIDYVEREFYRGVTIFHNQKAYFIALQSFEYALEKIVISKLGGEDYSELEPFICSYIGLCYIFSSDKKKGEKYFNKSIEIIKSLPLQKWEKIKGEIYFHMGIFKIENNQIEEGKRFLRMTNQYCLEYGFLYCFEEAKELLECL